MWWGPRAGEMPTTAWASPWGIWENGPGGGGQAEVLTLTRLPLLPSRGGTPEQAALCAGAEAAVQRRRMVLRTRQRGGRQAHRGHPQ